MAMWASGFLLAVEVHKHEVRRLFGLAGVRRVAHRTATNRRLLGRFADYAPAVGVTEKSREFRHRFHLPQSSTRSEYP